MKNKTKKWFILLLVLGFIFTMSACSSGENDTSTNESAPATGETENTDTPENSAVAVEDSGILGVYDQKPVPSLKGKTIGVSVIGTNKHLNSMFYKGTLDKIEELGGTAIGVDAEQNDQKRLSDLDNLLVQKPDAIIGILGDAQVCAPSYKKISELRYYYFDRKYFLQ
jgi:ribose transport system substrate-binding protein